MAQLPSVVRQQTMGALEGGETWGSEGLEPPQDLQQQEFRLTHTAPEGEVDKELADPAGPADYQQAWPAGPADMSTV